MKSLIDIPNLLYFTGHGKPPNKSGKLNHGRLRGFIKTDPRIGKYIRRKSSLCLSTGNLDGPCEGRVLETQSQGSQVSCDRGLKEYRETERRKRETRLRWNIFPEGLVINFLREL